MSVEGWHTVLVLGGIRSGKSAFAESLVSAAASVRYVATAVGAGDDPEWLGRIEAHQRRRPQSWSTEQTGADPDRLIALLGAAAPDETLLVDDLGGWVAALLDPARQPSDDEATVAALAAAVSRCPARLVLVSPEVGLSLVPTTPVGRAFADALGAANQALAAACDRVALVLAGQPTWLKPAPAESTTPAATATPAGTATPAQTVASGAAGTGATGTGAAGSGQVAPVVAEPARLGEPVEPGWAAGQAAVAGSLAAPAPAGVDVLIEGGMDLPLPDSEAGADLLDRLAALDVPGAGLGVLSDVVEFAATTQGTAAPQPWRAVRVLLLHGDHAGGASAGADPAEAARRAEQALAGEGALARLAAAAGADVQVVRAQPAAAIEDGPALDDALVDEALRQGWQLAVQAADDGRDALVLGACGAGTDAAAAAVLAALTGAEPVTVLGRVLAPGGRLDDPAWMTRAATVRDALRRTRRRPSGAKDVLRELGGGDLALATGVLLGAASRRLPVLLDGPVGISAGLISRDLASQARHWCLLADHGNQPAVRQGADVLGLTPVLSLGLDLGEGANVLAALPLLRAAIGLAAALPAHPGTPAPEPGDSFDAGPPAEFPAGHEMFAEPPDPASADSPGTVRATGA